MDKKKNCIYLFFELREYDDYGILAPDANYSKCWHGARQTFKLSKTMKASLKSKPFAPIYIIHSSDLLDMINHLKSKFPEMYQLYESFQNRDTLPTPFEVKIALASKDITTDQINDHLKTLKVSASSGTIQGAFDRQTREYLDYINILF